LADGTLQRAGALDELGRQLGWTGPEWQGEIGYDGSENYVQPEGGARREIDLWKLLKYAEPLRRWSGRPFRDRPVEAVEDLGELLGIHVWAESEGRAWSVWFSGETKHAPQVEKLRQNLTFIADATAA